jgi:hypothetical protein
MGKVPGVDDNVPKEGVIQRMDANIRVYIKRALQEPDKGGIKVSG